jgi:LysM repeat protein
MNHYNVPRVVATGLLISLLSACALFHKKPAPAPMPVAAPAPATVTAPAAATAVPVIQPSAPQRYTVKKGDTLWGIASMYLRDAWAWPDIWYANPDIKIPHLIYPGDVLILGYNSQGRPSLSVQRNGQTVTETSAPPVMMAPTSNAVAAAPTAAAVTGPALPVTKMEPQVHYQPLSAAVTAIPLDGLRPFLSKTRVASSSEFDDAGYLLSSFQGGPASGSGGEVYARNLKPEQGARYQIFRKGQKYVDPDRGDSLGYEAQFFGDASVEAWTDPAKLMITDSVQEALQGDRFLPNNGDNLNLNFQPHRPGKTVDGQIMAVLGGVGQIGQYAVVVLNRGNADGVDPGTVLGIFRKGTKVNDLNAGFFSSSSVTLPTERSGTLMVFRSFDRVSYALVMQATHEIHLEDMVANP